MIWKRHIDLPTMLSDRMPRFATEIIVALAGIALAVGLRLIIERVAPNVVPFALTFPVIAAVTIMAGTRAGIITLVGCQLLIWYAILPPHRSFAIDSITTSLNLLLVTGAQLLLLWAVSSYRDTVELLLSEDGRKIDDLSLALREMDHRTKNNFQLAIGMLTLQRRDVDDPALRSILDRAAGRLQAIASIYKNLAPSSADLQRVHLHNYLEDIFPKMREGLLSPAINLVFDVAPLTVRHDLAIRIGLIVNELVTNAAKHAFPEGVGTILVKVSEDSGQVHLEVRDDGQGIAPDMPAIAGLGTKLVHMLVRQSEGVMNTACEDGTVHRIQMPLHRS